MKNLYKMQWQFFKEDYWKSFLGIFFVFIFGGFSTYWLLLNNTAIIDELMGQVVTIFEEKNMLEPELTRGEIALKLFTNNFLASLFVFLTGFIPIFIPTLLILGLNGAMIGVLFAYIKVNGGLIAPMFFAGILPHGIFEIPALVMAGALAFYISRGFIKKLSRTDFPMQSVVKNAFVSFLAVCVPLLIIAAIIEAYITPILLEQFM